MRLPDGTGMDVIAALEAAKANAVVIVASAYLEDYRSCRAASAFTYWANRSPCTSFAASSKRR